MEDYTFKITDSQGFVYDSNKEIVFVHTGWIKSNKFLFDRFIEHLSEFH
jgi:hypothetical protein